MFMAPTWVGPTDRGYGLFTDVLDDYLYLDLLLAAAIHVVVLRHLEIFIYAISVLAFAAIELIWLAVIPARQGRNFDEIVAIPPVEDVLAPPGTAAQIVVSVAPVDDVIALAFAQLLIIAVAPVDDVIALAVR